MRDTSLFIHAILLAASSIPCVSSFFPTSLTHISSHASHFLSERWTENAVGNLVERHQEVKSRHQSPERRHRSCGSRRGSENDLKGVRGFHEKRTNVFVFFDVVNYHIQPTPLVSASVVSVPKGQPSPLTPPVPPLLPLVPQSNTPPPTPVVQEGSHPQITHVYIQSKTFGWTGRVFQCVSFFNSMRITGSSTI